MQSPEFEEDYQVFLGAILHIENNVVRKYKGSL